MKANSPRVLILEDEWLIAEQLEGELKDAGFEVVGPAGSVQQALQLIEQERVDVAVLDVSLRNEKSFPVAEVLQASATPFVFMSGYVAADLPPPFSGSPLVNKPIKPGELCNRIRTLLSRPEQ